MRAMAQVTVRGVAKHIAIGARGLWFDSGAGQIGHSVTIGFSLLRYFFGTVLF